MRKILIAALAAIAICATATAIVLLTAATPTAHATERQLSHHCARPLHGVTVKHRRADAGQRSNIRRVLIVGHKMGATPRVLRSGVLTITQEASARNLKYGDGSSVGLFQMISMWGSEQLRRNVEWAARWYFSRAIPIARRSPGMSAPGIAQAVQRSAHPGAYRQWTREASRTVAQWHRCQ